MKIAKMYSNENLIFTSYFFVSVLLIFMYGSYRCNHPEYKDILEGGLGIGELDGWSLSHLFFFMLIGYKYKDNKYLIFAFVLGIIWELFEHFYGEKRPGWLGGYGDCEKLQSDKNEDGNWWYGKWTDIIMNGSGLIIGYYLKKQIKK